MSVRDTVLEVIRRPAALQRLVSGPEWNDFSMLAFRVDRIEHAFGVRGAVVLFFTLGVTLWMTQALTPIASSTSPSPTRVDT